MRAASRLLAAGLLALLAGSCQLRLATEVELAAGGSGQVVVGVALDRELVDLLDRSGVDLLRGLETVRGAEGPWRVDGGRTDDGGIAVELRATFDDPAGLPELVEELHAPLDDEDVRLFERLSVEPLEGGAVRFSGGVGLRLPSAPGAREAGVEFDRGDLEAFLRERPESVVYDVRVTLPAPPLEHDADEVEGRTLVWHAPVGAVREVTATSEQPGGVPPFVWVAGAVAAATVAGSAWLAFRRSG